MDTIFGFFTCSIYCTLLSKSCTMLVKDSSCLKQAKWNLKEMTSDENISYRHYMLELWRIHLNQEQL